MAKVITNKWENGKLVSQTTEEIDWKPNAADLDTVTVGCKCGFEFDIPWDALAFGGFDGMFCGECFESGKMSVIADPSKGK